MKIYRKIKNHISLICCTKITLYYIGDKHPLLKGDLFSVTLLCDRVKLLSTYCCCIFSKLSVRKSNTCDFISSSVWERRSSCYARRPLTRLTLFPRFIFHSLKTFVISVEIIGRELGGSPRASTRSSDTLGIVSC